jgi:hypothetical protein
MLSCPEPCTFTIYLLQLKDETMKKGGETGEKNKESDPKSIVGIV